MHHCLLVCHRSTQTPPGGHKFRTPSPEPVPIETLGAIPKSCPAPDADFPLPEPRSEAAALRKVPTNLLEDGLGARKRHPRKDHIPLLDGDDSSGSSPDIDAILNRTLNTSRLEPLSPQEMDAYLSKLYRQRGSAATQGGGPGAVGARGTSGRIRKTKSVSVPSWMRDDEILLDDDDDLPARIDEER